MLFRMDRIGDVLRAHLQAAELQLAAAEDGIEISRQDAEGVPFVVIGKEQLLSRVNSLREALARHEARTTVSESPSDSA
jgi:hypothetical protein